MAPAPTEVAPLVHFFVDGGVTFVPLAPTAADGWAHTDLRWFRHTVVRLDFDHALTVETAFDGDVLVVLRGCGHGML